MSLRLEKVGYIYGENSGQEKRALSDINLEIGEGEFIGLVGHTGSGKSTLAQLLNGLEKASEGDVLLDGVSIYGKDFSLQTLRHRVGMVFQYPEHQLFEPTVQKDVEFGPRNMGLPQLEIQMRSFRALKLVGIEDELLDVSPFRLSGGQKRRIAIAGVLAMQPDILVLDEPMAGLDPAGREEILQLLRRLHREQNITIILISHSMEDVANYVDRMLVMNEGKLVLDGAPRDIFQFEDELEKIGLGVPLAAKVIHRLRERGAVISGEYVTIAESAEAIAGWLSGKAE